MTIGHYTLPRQRITITHSAVDYTFESNTLSCQVTRRENAAASAVITSSDFQWVDLYDHVDIADNVKIEFKYVDKDDTYTQVFGGYVRNLDMSTTAQGDQLTITALGYGVAFTNMLVLEEYGEESKNPTEKTITDILTDATIGIIPNYVQKVMGGAASGYTIDTSEVAALANDYPYLYFNGKPASKCLQDLLDLYRAAKVANAGAHWLVVPSGTTAYFCLGTVGAHEAAIVATWPTWYDTDATNSTLEVGVQNLVTGFRKVRADANYVLYSGNFRRPGSGDFWTENNAASWDTFVGAGSIALANDTDAADVTVGGASLRADYNGAAGQAGWFFYPGTHDAAIDLTQIESPNSIPYVSFYLKQQNTEHAGAPGLPLFAIGTGDPAAALNHYFIEIGTFINTVADDKWIHFRLPIGNYYDQANNTTFYTASSSDFAWEDNGGGDWSDIDWFGFWFEDSGAGTGMVHVDGFHIGGQLIRAAYDSTKIAAKKCRMMVVQDDVPKDDSLVAATDTGVMAQFAKAELARAAMEPTVGEVKIPLLETLLPGQKMHVHACKQADGTFRIDADMRVIQVVHDVSLPHGATSTISLTTDIKNSYPVHPTDQYSQLYKAVAPAFQDRMRASLIRKDVDLELPILAKDYNTATWD
jgi:hypothetical protein